MRYQTSSVELPYGWRETASAFWRKYPNPHAKHVKSEDVVLREVDGPIMRTIRVLTKTNSQPKWTERVIGKAQSSVVVIEESIINALEQTLTTYTRNIGYYNDKFATIEERCEQTPVDGNTTRLRKQAWVHSCHRGITRWTIEKFCIQRMKMNSSAATKGYLHTMEAMFGRPPVTLVHRIPNIHTNKQ